MPFKSLHKFHNSSPSEIKRDITIQSVAFLKFKFLDTDHVKTSFKWQNSFLFLFLDDNDVFISLI